MSFTKRINPFYQAQDILSRRDHSEYELRSKMRRKGFSQALIDDAVAKLKRLDLLNDEKFAAVYAENILSFKPVGPRWLKHKLKQKGIAPAIIDEALADAFPPGREEELAQQAAAAWRRVHPPSKGAPPAGGGDFAFRDSNRQRLTRYLASRGFSYTAIESVIDQ